MPEAIINRRGVRKAFGTTRALDGLDFSVAPGEVHGFLGPTGAGKSTAIRVLLDLLRIDGGTARLAYVPGDVTLWPKLTGGEIIDLFGRRRSQANKRKRDELIERFELDPKKKPRTYSKDYRQKVGLIAAVASDVELLILDKPTSGLDPLMEEVFEDCICEVKHAGHAVLLSSHRRVTRGVGMLVPVGRSRHGRCTAGGARPRARRVGGRRERRVVHRRWRYRWLPPPRLWLTDSGH